MTDNRELSHRDLLAHTERRCDELRAAATEAIRRAHEQHIAPISHAADREIAAAHAARGAEIERREVGAKAAMHAELGPVIAEILHVGAPCARAEAIALRPAIRDLDGRFLHAIGRGFDGRDLLIVVADAMIAKRPELVNHFTHPDALTSGAFGGRPLDAAARVVRAALTGAGPADLQDALADLEASIERDMRVARAPSPSAAARWAILSRGGLACIDRARACGDQQRGGRRACGCRTAADAARVAAAHVGRTSITLRHREGRLRCTSRKG
jgi:hypothetical protein